MATKRFTQQQKRDIFHELVDTQDHNHSVRKSYEMITEKYDISEDQLKAIEEEGLENEWPPLVAS